MKIAAVNKINGFAANQKKQQIYNYKKIHNMHNTSCKKACYSPFSDVFLYIFYVIVNFYINNTCSLNKNVVKYNIIM